eukprot:TRINITY_DN15627_c0_g1_i1.p1 TRINITY_DN15627_c0_g1~~TRINITY_DN15627_c0_g1_i1.p1  ORF type:complete len:133 (+),score=21.37 TRINITY_DN15627_c0_g1_i1:72-470(+)
MLDFFMVVSEGKVRLSKIFDHSGDKAEVMSGVARRCGRGKEGDPDIFDCLGTRVVACPHKDMHLAVGVGESDNELGVLQTLHDIIEILEETTGDLTLTNMLYQQDKVSKVLSEVMPNGTIGGYDPEEILRGM